MRVQMRELSLLDHTVNPKDGTFSIAFATCGFERLQPSSTGFLGFDRFRRESMPHLIIAEGRMSGDHKMMISM
jgi:hypothetical protein